MTEAVRLARNLDTVEANIRLFGKIMDETDIPGTENANDKKLLEKLDGACHKMQERLTILLSELDQENYENVFMNGLRINEDLNSVFVRYERFKKSRPKIDDDVAPLAADPCPTGLLVDIGDSNQGSGNQGPPAGTPSTPGQVNEEFWLNMTDPNPNTEPMGQSEFDKFLAKSK